MQILNRPIDIVYIDESGFDNFQALSKGYALKGTGPIIIEEAVRSKNLTLILAVSFNYGVICYQFLDKHVN